MEEVLYILKDRKNKWSEGEKWRKIGTMALLNEVSIFDIMKKKIVDYCRIIDYNFLTF